MTSKIKLFFFTIYVYKSMHFGKESYPYKIFPLWTIHLIVIK